MTWEPAPNLRQVKRSERVNLIRCPTLITDSTDFQELIAFAKHFFFAAEASAEPPRTQSRDSREKPEAKARDASPRVQQTT